MSQYKCVCGHWWSDVAVPTDGYPNEGWLLRDQDRQGFMDDVSSDVASFIEAVRIGKRQEWLQKYFGQWAIEDFEPYSDDATVVNDILLRHGRELFIYQCENCGRLWLQERPGAPTFRSFAPDGEWKDSLTGGGSYEEEKLRQTLDRLRERRTSR